MKFKEEKTTKKSQMGALRTGDLFTVASKNHYYIFLEAEEATVMGPESYRCLNINTNEIENFHKSSVEVQLIDYEIIIKN